MCGVVFALASIVVDSGPGQTVCTVDSPGVEWIYGPAECNTIFDNRIADFGTTVIHVAKLTLVAYSSSFTSSIRNGIVCGAVSS